MQTKEDNQTKKTTLSGNTKEKQKEEKNQQEERRRLVPPPATARVDESKIDEVAVVKLEEARKAPQRVKDDTPTGSGNLQPQTPKEIAVQTELGTTEVQKREWKDKQPNRERPASPMRPGEETPIEGGTSAEEIGTDEGKDSKKERNPEPDWTWHRTTKPAEEQVTYLVLWLQKEDTHHKRWEAHWSEDQKDKDEEELAKRLQSLDNVFGEGITYNKIQTKLATLREDEDEHWQREHGDKQYTGGQYEEDNARWGHHS